MIWVPTSPSHGPVFCLLFPSPGALSCIDIAVLDALVKSRHNKVNSIPMCATPTPHHQKAIIKVSLPSRPCVRTVDHRGMGPGEWMDLNTSQPATQLLSRGDLSGWVSHRLGSCVRYSDGDPFLRLTVLLLLFSGRGEGEIAESQLLSHHHDQVVVRNWLEEEEEKEECD